MYFTVGKLRPHHGGDRVGYRAANTVSRRKRKKWAKTYYTHVFIVILYISLIDDKS